MDSRYQRNICQIIHKLCRNFKQKKDKIHPKLPRRRRRSRPRAGDACEGMAAEGATAEAGLGDPRARVVGATDARGRGWGGGRPFVPHEQPSRCPTGPCR